MHNKKISSRIQAVPKLFDQTLLFVFVEINHDIAAQDDVVTARQELGFQIVKIELHEFFELRLDLVLIAGFFKIAEPAGVIHGLHLLLGVETFLPNAKTGIAAVRSDDFHLPWPRHERLRRWHIEGKRIPQVVVGERIADQNGDGVRLVAGGATSAPDAAGGIAALLLPAKELRQKRLMKALALQ